MLTVDQLLEDKGLASGFCHLNIEIIGEAQDLTQAWSLLPEQGQGYVVCADKVQRFDPSNKTGFMLEAEVYLASDSTILLRSQGRKWVAWKWLEAPGTSHRYVEHTYLSSEPGSRPANLCYRQYWTQQTEDGIQIWRPLGARFCGFR